MGAVVEIDHLPRAEQEQKYAALAKATSLKWTIKVFSGGKSVHACLAFDRLVAATDPIRLEIQQLLVAILEGDTAIVDPGRLTRLPGWIDPSGRREQPLLHIDDEARYFPEDIRDRLATYATSLGMTDLQRTVDALRLAKRLEDAAHAPRNALSGFTAPNDAVALVARLRATRFAPEDTDCEHGEVGAVVLRMAAQLHSKSEDGFGEAALELREHADHLRRTWRSPQPDDIDLAHAMLGKAPRRGEGITRAGSGGSDGDHHLVSAEEMEPFRALSMGTRVVAPCCGTGGSGRTDGSAVVMHQPGESPRIFCHRCGHTVMIEPDPVAFGFRTFGFRTFGFDGIACFTTSPKKRIEPSSATPPRYLTINGERLTDELPDPVGFFGKEGGILIVRSPQATGKTHLAGVIAKECNVRWPDEAQLAPTHRVALVRNLAGRLDFETYDVDPKAPKVTTTLDSICRVPSYTTGLNGAITDREFSFVLLDEVSQLLRHAVGGTIGNDASRVLGHLRCILSSARHIVATDADANDNVIEILQRLAPRREIVVVDNQWRPGNRKARMYDNRKAHLADFMEDVRKGRKVAYLTCAGPNRAATVARMVKDARHAAAVRVYSQDTSKLDEVQDEMADIDAAMKKYDVVIATPTLGSGVDIQDPDFERVYLDVPAHDVGADEAVQLGFRIRNPKDRTWRVWVGKRKRRRETDPARIRAELLDVRRQTEGTIAKQYKNSPLVTLVSPTEMSPQDDLHLDLYCRAWSHIHSQTNDLRKTVRARLEEAGFTIEEAPTSSEAVLKAMGDSFADTKEKTTRERAGRITRAAAVTMEEADRISRARTAKQEEMDAAEKAHITFFYGQAVDEALVVEDDRGSLRAKVALLAIYLLARDQQHQPALMRDVQRLGQGLTARVRGQYIAAMLLKKVLALYGISGKVENHTGAVVPVQGFEREIRRYLRLIKMFLGVAHGPKTKSVNGKKVRISGIDEMRLLSRVLARFGLKLSHKAKRNDGKVVRSYWIDTDVAAHRIALAEAARARLIDALAKLEEEEAEATAPAMESDEIDIDAILAGLPATTTARVSDFLGVPAL